MQQNVVVATEESVQFLDDVQFLELLLVLRDDAHLAEEEQDDDEQVEVVSL